MTLKGLGEDGRKVIDSSETNRVKSHFNYLIVFTRPSYMQHYTSSSVLQ